MRSFRSNTKGLKPLTLVLILGGIIVFAMVAGTQLEFGEFKTGMVYSGRVKINNVEVKRLDGSNFDVGDSIYRVLHGSGEWNDKVGDYSSDSITGDLKDADNGVWYLTVDYGTNTSQWLDFGETLKDPYVRDIFGRDGDRDGFDETYIELYLGGLEPLKAGESYKEVEVTTTWNVPDLNPAFTSLTNASSIGTTSYSYYTATGYMTGTAEGECAKLAKIHLDFSSSGNDTYPDSEYWKLTHLKIGPYTFTGSQFGGYDKANKRYKITFGDQINHFGGKDLYYPKNAGDLWASYELKAYCNYPSSSQNILVTIQMYFYSPAGTLTSAISRTVTFNS